MEQNQIKRYPPVVTFEENDGKKYFRASFKEFPDMIGGIGNTVEAAIAAAYEMLDAEIDFREEMGLPVPSPTVVALSEDPSGRVTVRMSKTLHRRLIAAAEEEGVSLNSLINEAIVDRLSCQKSMTLLEKSGQYSLWYYADNTVKPWMQELAQTKVKDATPTKSNSGLCNKSEALAAA